MKTFAFSVMIAVAALVGVGSVASAQYDSTTTTTTTSIVDSGAGPPTTVDPSTTTSQVVVAAPLPTTGSGGISTSTGIAIGLLVVGFGLFVVARVRRAQPGGT